MVPVLSTLIVGGLCVGILWLAVIQGAGLDLHDTEDFNRVGLAISETLEYRLEKGGNLESLNTLLENNGMAAEVYLGEESIYSYGIKDENITNLKAASKYLEGDCVLSQNGYNLYRKDEVINENTYTLYLYGLNHSEVSYSNLKVALVMSAILIVFTILTSILLTNRFLTKFVFKRIEEPLDILIQGVHEIRDGNLDCRITYNHNDEFLAVCNDFNTMAAHLQQSVQKAQQEELSRKELIAGISHDIRSPLTSIQAYVEGLLDGVAQTEESRQKYLVTIKRKAEELDRLVSSLFLYSKMELGEYNGHIEILSLNEKIKAVVDEVQKDCEMKGLTIQTDLKPVRIEGDELQIERMITNVLSNSMKYKEKEHGLLRITLNEENGYAKLLMEDDGPGVNNESLPHLFEAFYRDDQARKNPQNGSGLGLAIVKQIVMDRKGSVRAFASVLGGLGIEILIPSLKEKE